MNLSFPAPALTPTVNDFTYNSAPSGSVTGAYDLICFPGMMISCLADDTATTSTGSQRAVEHLYIESHVRRGEIGALSAGSADSSVLGDWSDRTESGGFATQFRFPYREPAYLDLAALMLLLGGFAALLDTTVQALSPDVPHAVE